MESEPRAKVASGAEALLAFPACPQLRGRALAIASSRLDSPIGAAATQPHCALLSSPPVSHGVGPLSVSVAPGSPQGPESQGAGSCWLRPLSAGSDPFV